MCARYVHVYDADVRIIKYVLHVLYVYIHIYHTYVYIHLYTYVLYVYIHIYTSYINITYTHIHMLK